MATVAKEVASGESLRASYRICERVGVVQSSDTRAETEVSGTISGGGGSSYGGTGYTAPVSGSVQSKTTRYQNIFLKDDDGHEHAIELTDFLVTCKEGQRLSLFILKPGSDNTGPYYHAYNHNTRENYSYPKAVRSALFPLKEVLILVALFAVIGAIMGGESKFWNAVGFAVVAGIVFWVAGSIVAMIRASHVRKNSQFVQYLASLGTG